ncbi:unnamed protein product [Hermetia illucens]|uniref:Uncharacterized protein n=1 Tax=Hermetia illucens TaxID=343691 RepID=A0A7R8UFW2_HERIL|nr:unnamed protein product [Hermetia illucens]
MVSSKRWNHHITGSFAIVSISEPVLRGARAGPPVYKQKQTLQCAPIAPNTHQSPAAALLQLSRHPLGVGLTISQLPLAATCWLAMGQKLFMGRKTSKNNAEQKNLEKFMQKRKEN